MHINQVKTLKTTAMKNLNTDEGKQNTWSPKNGLKKHSSCLKADSKENNKLNAKIYKYINIQTTITNITNAHTIFALAVKHVKENPTFK